MKHPLIKQLDRVRRKLIELVWLRAVFTAIAAIVAACFFWGGLDWLLRSETASIRWLITLGVFGSVTFAIARWIIPALTFRPTRLHVARQVEKHAPVLQDRLSTSIELVTQGGISSDAIRRFTVDAVSRDLGNTRLDSVIERRPVWRAFLAALGFVVMITAVWIVQPTAVKQALVRAVTPWSEYQWPRRNAIQFEPIPQAVARGESFDVVAWDRNGRLNRGIQLELETPDTGGKRTFAMRPMAGKRGKFRLRLENIQRSFRIRASGGDDRTPWVSVTMIEAPVVTELNTRIHPPAYTLLKTSQSQGQIQAWPDSQIEIRGRCDNPITAATVYYDNGIEIRSIPAQVSSDPHEFVLAVGPNGFQCDRSGWYWIVVTNSDLDYQETPNKWKVSVIADRPPQWERVDINGAQNDREMAVGVDSNLEFSLYVNDELSLSDARLQASGAIESEQPLELVEVDESGGRQRYARRYAATARLSLSAFDQLRPGQQITIVADAVDLSGNRGESTAVNLSVVSKQTLMNALYRQEKELSMMLQQLQTFLRQSQRLTEQIHSKLDDSSIRVVNQDLLQVQQLTRKASQMLSDSTTPSVAGRVSELLEFAAIHRLRWPGAPVVKQVQLTTQQLDGIWLPEITNRVQNVLELTASPGDKSTIGSRLKIELPELRAAQSTVDDLLTSIVGRLNQTSIARTLATGFAAVAESQIQVAGQLQSLAAEAIGRPVSSADAQALFRQQQQIRDRTEQLIADLNAALSEEYQQPPGLRQILVHSRQLTVDLELVANLVGVESHLQQMRWGVAGEAQQAVLTSLEAVARSLDPQIHLDPKQALQRQQLDRHIGNLASLADQYKRRLQQLLAEYDSTPSDQLEERRSKLDDQRRKLVGQLRNLADGNELRSFESSANLVDRATDIIEAAPNQIKADSLATEINALQTAIDLLHLAMQELSGTSSADNLNLAETIKKLDSLIDAQSSLSQELELNAASFGNPQWTVAARTQATIRDSFNQIARGLPRNPIMNWLVEQIQSGLRNSQQALSKKQFSDAILEIQQSSIRSMQRLVDVLLILSNNPLQNTDPQSTQPPGSQQQAGAIANSLELITLYVLQKQLHEDMQTWHREQKAEDPPSATAPAAARTRTEELNRRQRELAKFAQEIAARIKTGSTSQVPPMDIPEIPDF